ncbi:biotin--[acetyl-CoA-carboxylase] ligase [Spirochaetia bacterium]|nr:biotin--[acetyl-CoA-carboxylase] ligase [Spirochaetia bacterium]
MVYYRMMQLDIQNPFGAPVYFEEILSSTMDESRILANRNEPHGTVLAADFQEKGRGRIPGRPWIMDKGLNLSFTILLRYKDFSAIPQALTLRAGLAVLLAIEDFAPPLGDRVQIKWPNDIMVDSKKVSGILTEGDGKNMFIGIGVNVGQKEFPEPLQNRAVSIFQALNVEEIPDRFDLLEKILGHLYSELNTGFSSWQSRLTDRLYKKGEMVRFIKGHADSGQMVEGRLSGIGPKGELLIIPQGEKDPLSFITGELDFYPY